MSKHILDIIPVPQTADANKFLRGDNTWYDALTKDSLDSMLSSGSLTAQTAKTGTNTDQIATTAFVNNTITGVIDSAPETLNTLNELASALGDDPNFATTISTNIGKKADKVVGGTSGNVVTLDSSGNILDSGKTLGVSVPSTAKFTDTLATVTVTGSGNAITSITDSNGALSASKEKTFLTASDISDKADKASSLSGYGIADAKIVDGVITLGDSTITPITSSSVTGSGNAVTTISYNNGVITASKEKTFLVASDISGKADKVSSATAGNVVTLDSEGNILDSGKTLGISVPSDAKFTDTNTHYDSKNVVGSSTALSNTTTILSNGNVYLNSVENGVVTSSHNISGTGATTVITDDKGNIVIGSTNTTYTNMSLGNGYATCTTEEATTAKVATLSSYSLSTMGRVTVKFTNAVPANSTLNINSTGAKSIYCNGSAITAGIITAENLVTFIYDGTNYIVISVTDKTGVTTSSYYVTSLDNVPSEAKDGSIVFYEYEESTDLSTVNTETITTTVLNSVSSNYAPLASPALTGTPTAPTADSSTNTTQIATTAFVQSVVDTKIAAADAIIYKGTIGTSGTVTSLPDTTAKVGWAYKVVTSGTYASQKCEVGDMIICLTNGSNVVNATWTVVQNNTDLMTGASSTTDGSYGFVPTPSIGDQNKFLRGDATWVDINSEDYRCTFTIKSWTN